MPTHFRDELRSVNSELRDFLERADTLVHGTGDIDAGELGVVHRLLESTGARIGEASRSAAIDAALRAELQTYADRLRALEVSLNQVRCVVLARRAQLEAAQQHMHGLRDWVNAYRQTAP